MFNFEDIIEISEKIIYKWFFFIRDKRFLIVKLSKDIFKEIFSNCYCFLRLYWESFYLFYERVDN